MTLPPTPPLPSLPASSPTLTHILTSLPTLAPPRTDDSKSTADPTGTPNDGRGGEDDDDDDVDDGGEVISARLVPVEVGE